MEFNIKLRLLNSIMFSFADDEMIPIDLNEGEPQALHASIDSDDETNIGSIYGYLLYNDTDFWEQCDVESGDCEIIASTICKADGSVSEELLSNENKYSQIFILDKIEINEKFRNKGIGSSVLKKLPEMLQYQFDAGHTIFLNVSDYESASCYGFDSAQYRKGSERLMTFYKKFGYKTIKNNVMVWKTTT